MRPGWASEWDFPAGLCCGQARAIARGQNPLATKGQRFRGSALRRPSGKLRRQDLLIKPFIATMARGELAWNAAGSQYEACTRFYRL